MSDFSFFHKHCFVVSVKCVVLVRTFNGYVSRDDSDSGASSNKPVRVVLKTVIFTQIICGKFRILSLLLATFLLGRVGGFPVPPPPTFPH